jgi:DNA-binding transcriptional MerR regulator
MSLTKGWYTIDEAVSKFGVSPQQLQAWIDEGLVRTEKDPGGAMLLNCYDIEQELHLVPSI